MFDDFFKQLNGKSLDYDGWYGGQCFDLVQAWNRDWLKIPKWLTGDYAYQIYGQLPEYYDSIPNTPSAIPQKGDIVVWKKSYNGWAGHTGVANGKGTTDWFECFQQNDPEGAVCQIKKYNYNHVAGWLRKKGGNIPAKKTVCLSAGHGAGDPGAVYQGLQEATLTEKITKRAVEMIRRHGVDCLEVPAELSLVETIQWINNRTDQINIALEVHINSGGGDGTEAWNYEGTGNESDKFSQFVVDAVAAETGLKNRGIKDETLNRHRKLGFIHDTNPIAALVEIAFIDGNYGFLNNDENLTRAAKGVARGCLSYLGITWKPELINPPAPIPPTPPVVPPNASDELYRVFHKGKQVGEYKTNPAVRVDDLEKGMKPVKESINKLFP